MMIPRSKKAIIEFKSVKISKSYQMERGFSGIFKLIQMKEMILVIIASIDFTSHAVLNAT